MPVVPANDCDIFFILMILKTFGIIGIRYTHTQKKKPNEKCQITENVCFNNEDHGLLTKINEKK